MKLPRRQFLLMAASAAALPALPRIARAQDYPARPVRIIVPFAPGGTFDIMARLIGQWLTEKLGQPFVIENRPGAGGNIGTETVVRAPADGYALLLVGTANAISVTLVLPAGLAAPLLEATAPPPDEGTLFADAVSSISTSVNTPVSGGFCYPKTLPSCPCMLFRIKSQGLSGVRPCLSSTGLGETPHENAPRSGQ